MGTVGSAPHIDGYTSLGDWDFKVSPGQGQFKPAQGPSGESWPLAPGNCTDQWFQLRWHASVPGSKFVAGYGTPGTITTKAAPSSRGWLSVDGCQLPEWELSSGTGDVVVVAEAFNPNN